MGFDHSDIDFKFAPADLCARLACLRAAVEACAPARHETALAAARELYASVMDGAGDGFRQLVLPRKR